MKKITISFKLLLIALFFNACSNDSSNDKIVQNSTGDYWPTELDNNWVYDQKGVETSIEITGTNGMNDDKYYQFNQLEIFGGAVARFQPISIKKNKGDYYIKAGELNRTVEGVNYIITGYEFLFFKDYLGVNETWEGTYKYKQTSTNFGFVRTEVTYTGKILEKGISLTVNGKVFNDVIKFRFEQIIDDLDTAWTPWDYSTDYWIAKDVGIIKFESHGVVSEIKSYTIK